MRTLSPLDWAVLASYLVLVFLAGLLLSRRAGRSTSDFFVGGRQLPWWLLGISMAATNFSIDTPIAITQFVTTVGVSGVWFFWASAISGLFVTFFFARLWRRSGVMTDAEIIELRYGGRPAAALRMVKGIYFGVLFNAFIMGWVFLAVIKVIGGLTNLPLPWLLAGTTGLVLAYSLAAGFYGVVVTDFVQYFVALAGSLLLAVLAVREVGGLSALKEGLVDAGQSDMLRFVPRFSGENLGPISVFLTYLLVQWWAHKYADGGGKHIQRMLAARDENHAFAASLLYSFVNYALQVWPWILTALASLLLFGQLNDPEVAYAQTMAQVLPAGLLGLVLAGLLGAFMSTIDTHLNLGASYMVNDIYRRFMVADASERHYVWVSRLAMTGLLSISVVLALNMSSVASAWKFLLTFASGAGPVWVLRWLWPRINAWSELSAMLASGVVATWLQWQHSPWLYSQKLLTTVALSAAVWLPVTFLTVAVDEQVLRKFAHRVRPLGGGWQKLSASHQNSAGWRRPLTGFGLSLLGLFGLNFALGAALLGSPFTALILLAAAAAALWALWRNQRQAAP